jgi:hypothetical protein
MIGNQGPGETCCLAFSDVTGQALYKFIAIDIADKNRPAFDPSGNDVVYGPRGVNSRLSGHDNR